MSIANTCTNDQWLEFPNKKNSNYNNPTYAKDMYLQMFLKSLLKRFKPSPNEMCIICFQYVTSIECQNEQFMEKLSNFPEARGELKVTGKKTTNKHCHLNQWKPLEDSEFACDDGTGVYLHVKLCLQWSCSWTCWMRSPYVRQCTKVSDKLMLAWSTN